MKQALIIFLSQIKQKEVLFSCMADSETKISLIIPCYNEEGNIIEIFSRLQQDLAGLNPEYLFIDDGSNDGTLQQIEDLASRFGQVKFISFSRNFGHQNAIKAGIENATGDCVIMLDADLQHPPSLIPEMIKLWKNGYDVVNTIRKDTARTGFFKRLTARLFYWLINKFSDVEIIPGTADFRLLGRKPLDELKNLKEYHLFYRGLIPWIGFRQYFLEYVPNKRYSGKTKYSLKKMLSFAANGITSFSTKPLKLAIYIGFVISFLAFLYAIYAIIIHFFTELAISGWSSLITSILFIGGLQIVILGVIGEYLGKLFMENKQRPSYIIQKTNIIKQEYAQEVN